MAAPIPLNAALVRGKVSDRSLDGIWTVSKQASRVTFSTRTMWGLATVRGSFTELDGEVAIVDGAVTARIAVETASLTTGSSARDKHLRSAEFFDCEHYPLASFVLSSMTPVEAKMRLNGTLTIRDRTRPFSMDPAILLPGSAEFEVRANFDIDRAHYGMLWNSAGMASSLNAVTATVAFTRS
jgi:polyisoprenoid-binding protein YceI